MYREYSWSERIGSATNLDNHRPSLSSSPSIIINNASGGLETAVDIDRKRLSNIPIPPQEKSCLTYYESIGHDIAFNVPVDEVILQGKTDFQDIKIFRTNHYGKCVIMDSHMQSAQSDECIYHESLVHPAMLSHPNPEVIFVGGGGEGATVREILKYKSVKRVIMVDIDKMAVKIFREHLPEWNAGIFDDPRLEIVYGDADAFLITCGIKFDVIFMDICDPTECGPGWKLYTKEFYLRVKLENMNGPNAILCTQSTGINVNLIVECFSVIYNTLRAIFGVVRPYRCDIPSFGCPWGFNMCSDNDKILGAHTSPEEIDELIRMPRMLGDEGESTLQHYDGVCHRHMFSLTKYERHALHNETRLFTLEHPVYFP